MKLSLSLVFGFFAGPCGAASNFVSWVDPQENSEPSSPPEEILVMFTEGMQASVGATLSICSQANAATGCVAECTSRDTLPSSGFRMQRSGQLASWPLSGFQFKQGCRYELNLAHASFSALRDSLQVLPATSWGFTVKIPTPKLSLATFVSATTTNIRIAMTWDTDAKVTCKAEPQNPPNQMSRTMDPVVVSRNMQTTLDLAGLIPGTTYAVKCHGALPTNNNIQSQWTAIGNFNTQTDLDSSLASLRIHTVPICPNGIKRDFEDQLLVPVFSPAVKSYEAFIFAQDHERACGPLNGGTAEWTVTVSPRSTSAFATVTTSWSASDAVGNAHRLALAPGVASAGIVVTFLVKPHSPVGTPSSYSVSVRANSTGSVAAGGTTKAPTTAAPAVPTATSTLPPATPPGAEAPCNNVAAQLGAENFGRSSCTDTLAHGATCVSRCPPGQTNIGRYNCQRGLLVGSAFCVTPSAQTQVISKVAGRMTLQLSSTANPAMEINAAMKAVLVRCLASSLGLTTADITRMDVAGVASRRLRRLAAASSVSMTYELLVAQPASLQPIINALSSLSGEGAARNSMAMSLTQDGYTLGSVSTQVQPFSFQDVQVLQAPGATQSPQSPSSPSVIPGPEVQTGPTQPPGQPPVSEEAPEEGGGGAGMVIIIIAAAAAVLVVLGAAFYWYRLRGFTSF